MGFLEWLLIGLTALFLLGALGCVLALPTVVWQFVRVLSEKGEGEEQQQAQAAD